MLILSWPGDGNSYTVDMLQQPHGVPGSSEDQKGTGCHTHDGRHQHESCADHHRPVQPGGGCVFCVYSLTSTTWGPFNTTKILLSLSLDFTKGLPHWPVTGQDPAHPGSNPREVCTVTVQPPLQDPPPVAYVPVCCHAARRPQLAVPQHHCSTGTGHWRHAGTVSPFTLTFPGAHRLRKPLRPIWRSGSPLTGRIWSPSSHFALFIMAVAGPWNHLDYGGVPVAGWSH